MKFLIRILTILFAFLSLVVLGLIVRVDLVGSDSPILMTTVSEVPMLAEDGDETSSEEEKAEKDDQDTSPEEVEKEVEVELPIVPEEVKEKNLSVILVGGGTDYYLTLQAIRDMPAAVAISLTPYGKRLAVYSKAALLKKHTVLLEIPIEQHDATSVKNDMPESIALQKLREVLSKFEGYSGVTSLSLHKLTNKKLVDAVLREFEERQLIVFDNTNIQEKSSLEKLPRITFVDKTLNEKTAETVEGLVAIEDLFKDKEHVVVMLPMSKVILENLKNWFDSFKVKNINLVPAS